MTWLLFMDESGHDHRSMPMEVRGGIALHTSKIWPFIQEWNKARSDIFGTNYVELGGEIKGSKLLEGKRLEWAQQMHPLSPEARRKSINRFLTKQHQKEAPTRREFTAYGQANLLMAEEIFNLLEKHEAVLFASLIPRGVHPPADFEFDHYLRKDHVFLQERFFYFLERKADHGLFIMDQTEKQQDTRFVKRLHAYYTKTHTGRQRTAWIVPSPLFVDSEMSIGVQAADLCLFCINWGFRKAFWNFTGPKREDIAQKFGGRLNALQFEGDGYRDGNIHHNYGIVYVPDPFTGRNNEP